MTICMALLLLNTASWVIGKLGLTYIWLQQTEMRIPFSLIKQRIIDSFTQSWYGTINNSNELLLYSRYKHDFEQEKYLDFIQENKSEQH